MVISIAFNIIYQICIAKMGGAVSAGEDNDDLIDNLVSADYIKTPTVERVFRAVDRADYYTDEHKCSAYKDLAWKHGHLHLSAPCIYSEVMESLKLEAGMSFLNLGSGTGYLNTMAGLILGTFGINHGVEIHDDVVDYAEKKLAEFKGKLGALDAYEFCEPQFVIGNCLSLDSASRMYDRVYCGAACPVEHENYMKNLINVNGILVMPLSDQLLQITRTSETTWETKSVLPVSFASLIQPGKDEAKKPVKLPDCEPLLLQEICRSKIRCILRQNVEMEHPEVRSQYQQRNTKPGNKRRSRKRPIRRLVIPLFGSAESDSDSVYNVMNNSGQDESSDHHHDLEDFDDDESSSDQPGHGAGGAYPRRDQLSSVIEQMIHSSSAIRGLMTGSLRTLASNLVARTESSSEDRMDDDMEEEEEEIDVPDQTSPKVSRNSEGDSGISSASVGNDSPPIEPNPQEKPTDKTNDMDTDPNESTDREKATKRPLNDLCESPESETSDEEDKTRDMETDEADELFQPSCSAAAAKPPRRGLRFPLLSQRFVPRRAVFWKRVALDESDGDVDSEDSELESPKKNKKDSEQEEKPPVPSYGTFLMEKINQLPLPTSIKLFINYYRKL